MEMVLKEQKFHLSLDIIDERQRIALALVTNSIPSQTMCHKCMTGDDRSLWVSEFSDLPLLHHSGIRVFTLYYYLLQ